MKQTPAIIAAAPLRRPYLLFLGTVRSETDAKTAFGLRDWAPDACLGQFRLPGCTVDLGLPDLTPAEAVRLGAGSIVIGVAPAGGRLDEAWIDSLEAALDAGLDLVSGLHNPLAEVPRLAAAAARSGAALVDVRRPKQAYPTGSGRKRAGLRALTVGLDCAIGKKYAALALTRELTLLGRRATFRATGQTGIMIAGDGIAIDAVVADFVAGAAEALSPDNAPDHWDVIEGQGSLFHPAYAGVSLGLLHGSQPDALVVCHDPARRTLDDLPHMPIPRLEDAISRHVEAALLTNPAARCVGVSVNTSRLDEGEARAMLDALSARLNLPAEDPLRTGLSAIAAEVTRIG